MQFQQAMCANNAESLYCKALAASTVQLYKSELGKVCEQASISGDYEKYVEEFAGFTKGTCADQGFTHTDGSKTLSVPIVGDITLALYDNVLGADKTVTANQITVYEMAGAVCGQASLDTKVIKYLEEYLSLKEGTCASQGFTVEDGEKDLDFPYVGDIKFDLFSKTVAQKKADKIVDLWQVKGAECGQIAIAKKYETYIEKTDKDLKEGTCASQGFTVEEGRKEVHVPLIGDVEITIFGKSAVKAAADAVSLYQVIEGVCGQTTVDKKFENILEKIDKKLNEGTCSSAGYTQDDGEKDVALPWVGEVKFALYTKPKNNLQMMI